MKIIVDGFGGDKAPAEVLKGCRLAVDEYGVEVILTGREKDLRSAASELGISLDGMEIIAADEIVTMEDLATDVVRTKKNSSMAVGLRALADGKGDAFVSAGNTGALVVGARTIVKCIEGMRRAALAPILPTATGCYMLLDGGANAECRPEMLLQFGLMGSVYMEKIMKIKNPRIGLVNIGEEDHKGTDLQREAYKLLRASNLNFIGNVEGRDIPMGTCDVVIADGFTGNIILKLTEGLGQAFTGKVKEIFKRNFLTKAAAMLVMPGLKAFRKSLDYTEYGGAPLMGIAKPVIKAHGSSNANAFKNAIRQAASFAREDVISSIKNNMPQKDDLGLTEE